MNDAPPSTRTQQKPREHQLVDDVWARLVAQHGKTDTRPQRTQITYEELHSAMTDAALLQIEQMAEGHRPPLMPGEAVAKLLSAALEIEGELAAKIHAGRSAVPAQRQREVLGYLRATLTNLTKHVTCFLEHPGTRLSHHGEDGDLATVRADVLASGEVMVTCTPVSEQDRVVYLPLSQLWPAGPASDVVRIVVGQLAKAAVSDMVADAVSKGLLKVPGVDALQAHPAYVVGPDGNCSPENKSGLAEQNE